MRALLVSLFSTLTISGSAATVPAKAEPVPHCVKVEQIGQLPLTVEVGDAKVTFTEWMAKDVDATELIGFRATTTGAVYFAVNAGGETYFASGTEWMNPHGVVGASVRGIDTVQICR